MVYFGNRFVGLSANGEVVWVVEHFKWLFPLLVSQISFFANSVSDL